MDKTNYSLLAIVAIVALTAIVAMYVSTDHSVEPIGPTIEFVDSGSADVGLTGYVSIERATREYLETTERERPGIALADFDYNGDGELTYEDSYILDAVVARERFCPPLKTCDVNEDDVVDTADRSDYFTAILRLQNAQGAVTGSYNAPKYAPPAGDDELWLATAGGAIN